MKKQRNLKVYLLFLAGLFLIFTGIAAQTANGKADFTVSEIIAKPDGFVYVKLKNLSQTTVRLSAPLKEKVFLTIYINNLKRAEYKLKYLDPKLFKSGGTIQFRTNFRRGKSLKISVVVNRLHVVQESNYRNNRRTRQF